MRGIKRKLRWAEKTAFDAFHLAEIEELCGDHAFFVCVQRHGLDVACSLVELCDKNGGYLPELHEYIKRYPQPLQAFAHAWVDLTTAIRTFAKRHPGNAILVRYEDMVREPETTLRSILEFVGEEWVSGLVRSGVKRQENLGLGDWKTYGKGSVQSTSVSRWKQLSRSTVSKLGEIVNPLLVECGYEPVPTEAASASDEVARRRYELGLSVNAIKRGAADTEGNSPSGRGLPATAVRDVGGSAPRNPVRSREPAAPDVRRSSHVFLEEGWVLRREVKRRFPERSVQGVPKAEPRHALRIARCPIGIGNRGIRGARPIVATIGAPSARRKVPPRKGKLPTASLAAVAAISTSLFSRSSCVSRHTATAAAPASKVTRCAM